MHCSLDDSVEVTLQIAPGSKIGIELGKRADGAHVIRKIAPGSVADRSGLLCEGDVIQAIDGERAFGHIEELVKPAATTHRFRIIASGKAEATESVEARNEMAMLKSLAETRRRSKKSLLHASGASQQKKGTATSDSPSTFTTVPAADSSSPPSSRMASSRSSYASSTNALTVTSPPHRETLMKNVALTTEGSIVVAAATTNVAAELSRKQSLLQDVFPLGDPSACVQVSSPAASHLRRSMMRSVDNKSLMEERLTTWGSSSISSGVAASPWRPLVRKREPSRRLLPSLGCMPTDASRHGKSSVMDKVTTLGSFPSRFCNRVRNEVFSPTFDTERRLQVEKDGFSPTFDMVRRLQDENDALYNAVQGLQRYVGELLAGWEEAARLAIEYGYRAPREVNGQPEEPARLKDFTPLEFLTESESTVEDLCKEKLSKAYHVPLPPFYKDSLETDSEESSAND